MTIKVANNAYSTLAAGINAAATLLSVAAGEGARFPTLSAGDIFYATLLDTSGNLEVIKVTARATDSMTIERAQDGTTARIFSTNDVIEIRPTAALFNSKIDKTSATGSAVLPAGTTAQQDATPAAGYARLNTTTAGAEMHNGTLWLTLVAANASQTFTKPQKTTPLTDNDLSFDLAAQQDFVCTPTGAGTLTFTNIAAGQKGEILLVNGSNYAIAKDAAVKCPASMLTVISATGRYRLAYSCLDGTNVDVTSSSVLA